MMWNRKKESDVYTKTLNTLMYFDQYNCLHFQGHDVHFGQTIGASSESIRKFLAPFSQYLMSAVGKRGEFLHCPVGRTWG